MVLLIDVNLKTEYPLIEIRIQELIKNPKNKVVNLTSFNKKNESDNSVELLKNIYLGKSPILKQLLFYKNIVILSKPEIATAFLRNLALNKINGSILTVKLPKTNTSFPSAVLKFKSLTKSKREVDLLFLVGVNSIKNNGAKFIVSLNSHGNNSTLDANVILPIPAFLEKNFVTFNYIGQKIKTTAILPSANTLKTETEIFYILLKYLNAISLTYNYNSWQFIDNLNLNYSINANYYNYICCVKPSQEIYTFFAGSGLQKASPTLGLATKRFETMSEARNNF